jgi:hypothetical protein
LTDEGSDYDLHAYTREAVPLEFRARLLKPRALGGKQDVWCLMNGPVSNACVSCTASRAFSLSR